MDGGFYRVRFLEWGGGHCLFLDEDFVVGGIFRYYLGYSLVSSLSSSLVGKWKAFDNRRSLCIGDILGYVGLLPICSNSPTRSERSTRSWEGDGSYLCLGVDSDLCAEGRCVVH